VTSATVNFDALVNLPSNPTDAFVMRRIGDGATVTLQANVITDSTTHVTLTFTGGPVEFGSLADGRYSLFVSAAMGSNASGNLDGNGDGTGGDDYVLIGDPAMAPKLFRFFGDVDGDGDTDAANFLAFRDQFLGLAPYDPALDFDGGGAVDAADFLQFRNRYLLGSI